MKIKITILFVLCVSALWAFGANAQTTYKLIEPLPGIHETTGFSDFIGRFIPFLLAFATLAAFVQIVFGGILRATSGGNPTAIGDANNRIWMAIGGLVLALSAYLILNTINPDLVSLRFFVPPVKIEAPTAGERIVVPGEGIDFVIQSTYPNTAEGRTKCQAECKATFGCRVHPQKQDIFVCPQKTP